MRMQVVSQGRLEAAEAEVETPPLEMRARETDGGRIAAPRQPVDDGPTRVAEAEELRRLVERLADGVVAGPAETRVVAGGARQVEPGVAAGHDQTEERKWHRVGRGPLEVDGQQVPFQMIDPDQRQTPALRDPLRQREADEQRAHQTRAAGDGDALDGV